MRFCDSCRLPLVPTYGPNHPMKLRDLLARLRRRETKTPAMTEPERQADVRSSSSGADDDPLLGPDGPLGPTGGQVGHPQRF